MVISWRVWVETQKWLLAAVVLVVMAREVVALSGPNVCMVKQKYNITKRIKYRAPMSIRTYEWCFSMPPRCSRWNTEMRDLTRLETEERTAEVAVCCPGYKMKDVSCVPVCPHGKTGSGCTEDCQPNRWGPNCVHECKDCSHGICSPFTGECICQEGWQGESCEIIISTSTTSTTTAEHLLTTSNAATKTTRPSSTEPTLVTTPKSTVAITTGSTTSTTIVTSTFLPTTPKIKVTPTQLATPASKSPSNQFSELTTPRTLLTNSSTYKEATSPIEKHIVAKTKVSEVMNSRNVIDTSTARTLEASNSTYASKLTTARVETKPVTLSGTDHIELKPTTEGIPTHETTARIFETTRPVLPMTTPRMYTTRKTETTMRIIPTTLKFKPKEIWIRPAQKGESPVIETKTKTNHDLTHAKHKNSSKIDIIPNTTPKTIIVSIIPTSVSYATFKKIALTTASYMSLKNHTFIKANKVEDGFTKAMSAQTSTAFPFTIPKGNTTSNSVVLTTTPSSSVNMSRTPLHTTLATTRRTSATKSVFVNKTTNSMSSTSNVVVTKLNSSNHLTMTTVSMTNTILYPQKGNAVTEKLSTRSINTTAYSETSSLFTTEQPIKLSSTNKNVVTVKVNTTNIKYHKAVESKPTNKLLNRNLTNTQLNVTKDETNTVTDKPVEDEEKFHILTEPEHITAVMSEKETERSSVDLISVISIAGGVMMAVITVAVIIVMMERCKRPRYDDIRKINDIRMQVMIDNNDIPPPYVRSIFHTPLPDPPSSEKCHYQPISTLDRNLKQFMRPVVVQTISPIMLENFRGILECHYDHLPRRSHDEYGSIQKRNSVTPSIDAAEKERLQRVSLTESAIDALKCEAKLDVIDSTTSEPLYAEIPCWRPPSEHAIEIINTNGEAVTEL